METTQSRIRAYRSAAELTQRQLADAAGVSIGVIRDLEQGRTAHLRKASAEALIRALGLDGRRAREFSLAVLGQAADSFLPAHAGRPAGPEQLTGLRLSVLGPLTAWRDGTPAELGPPLQQALLALLALSPNRLVHRETLIDALWGADPPATAVNQVQAYVSRLRRALDPDRSRPGTQQRLLSTGTGYRLKVTAEHLDLLAFQDLANRADAARWSTDAAACDLYEQALRLWRGDPLADVDRVRGHPAVIGLYQQRSTVIVAYAEAACGARLYSRVLPHLRLLTSREPLHERAHGLLMIVLAGSGWQAAALKVFEDLRHRLDEQLGMRPGAELADAHQRILRQQVPAARLAPRQASRAIRLVRGASAAPEPAVLRQLPPAIPHFACRSAELTALTGVMDRARKEGGTVAVSTISGTAGVGKSALALHWAHQVAGHFPDGQLYVDLRGYCPDAEPLLLADVLHGFLGALQVPAGRMPAHPGAGVGLYRSLLADRRMLIVLDNARDAGQARPLLPGSPGCLVLVTSRSRLMGLVAADGAQPLTLDVLGEHEARELLAGRLGSDRVAAEPQAATDLIRLCAHLPLALSIVAARAAVRPCLSLRVLADELRDPSTRLDALNTEEVAVSVRAAFSWSFKQLSGTAARMFVLLGAHPGPDISVPAAASLAGIPVRAARGALDQLVHAGLGAEYACGRYAFHDLLRAYAAEQARSGKTARRGAPLTR